MLFIPALDNQRRMYLFDFLKTQMNIPIREEQRRDFVACFLVNFRSFYQEETSMRFQESVFYSDVSPFTASTMVSASSNLRRFQLDRSHREVDKHPVC